MFCRKCGKENKEGSVFCYHCGTRFVTPQMTQTPQVQQMTNRPVKPQPHKKKQTATIILVVCIIILCLAIIGGIIALVVIGGKKKEKIKDFIYQVEEFEEFLDDVNYSSVQDDIVDLMEDCEKAINNRSVENFPKLEDRMREIRLKLGDISLEISSLEQLKHDYELRIEENYVIPEDMLDVLDELFTKIHRDASSGETKSLQLYQSELDEIISQLEQYNQGLVEDVFARVATVDLSEVTDEEQETLNSYIRELDEYIDMGNYRLAFDKALMYESYVREVEVQIAERTKPETNVSVSDEYICPGSDSRYLTEADLVGLSSWELLLARNEIFARHGRRFVDERIQAHFDSKSWYYGSVHPDNFNLSVFNQYELANIDFIKSHE